MKKQELERVLAPDMNARVAAQAEDAYREVWDAAVREGRVLYAWEVKAAVEDRLRAFLGPGVLTPLVTVRVNTERTAFEVDVRPGDVYAAPERTADVKRG